MIISYKNLASVRKKYPDKKIVFCSGSFDLIHPGHVLTFEALKKLGDILVVAVGGDKDIAEIKGPTRPILNEDLRLKMVDSLKPVDYALLNPPHPEGGWNSQTAPLEIIFNVFKPDVWAVYREAEQMGEREALSKKMGVPIVALEVPRVISTTQIIEKIRNLPE